MTENSDKTYERRAALQCPRSACLCCENAADEIERLREQIEEMLSLGQIPAEDVARHFVDGELRNSFSIARTGHEELGKAQTTTRLAEVIRRARLDGANACLCCEHAAEEIERLTGRVQHLEDRLEITHAWQCTADDTELKRIEIPREERDSFPDGITCRDATIKLLEE